MKKLNKMNRKKQLMIYGMFIAYGCKDTFSGFLSMLGNATFNEKTGMLVEY